MPINYNVIEIRAVFGILALAVPVIAEPPSEKACPDYTPTFFNAVGLECRPASAVDVWNVADQPTPFAWMTATTPLPTGSATVNLGNGDSFQSLLDRMSPLNEPDRSLGLAGVVADQGRWKYKHEQGTSLFKRNTSLDLPDPNEVMNPYAARNWKAQEKLQIPVPIPLPVAEQIFVYGQIEGSGEAWSNHPGNLYSKSGVGLKWSLPARSELQLRYATLLSYSDDLVARRYQERAQPAVEFSARVPLFGPLAIEYSGSAIPAVTRTDSDQLKQELRFAWPLAGDNELEFGARYRWEYAPVSTPWTDRTGLFFGIKLRH